MLFIRNAEIGAETARPARRLDVRCRDGRVVELGEALAPAPDEAVLEARGGALLPGLHDHHLHCFALAAALRSVPCGPPDVRDAAALRRALRTAPGDGWIRGVGYHESVAGHLHRQRLDEFCAARPLRIQHRSGKTWFFNSAGLRAAGLEQPADGRLFRGDDRLRGSVPAALDVAGASALLARYGVTGVTDATPENGADAAAALRARGMRQRLVLMGGETLPTGWLKIMLDDCALPDIDAFRARIEFAHRASRAVAIHCVTRTELVFAVATLLETGASRADRIEHASVADDAAMALVARAGITVVTQPNFIAERGDRYRVEAGAADRPFLYRCKAFLDAGVPLGGGTDAPFGKPDPWAAMRAAVHRATAAGHVLGTGEALTPERALALFTTRPADPGGEPRQVAVGATADLCLLNCDWGLARRSLSNEHVAATVIGGEVAFRAPPKDAPA